MQEYRMLEKGEIIKEGDEVDDCNDGYLQSSQNAQEGGRAP